jgi:ribosomal protein S18 acetylase RimI-like enzyme
MEKKNLTSTPIIRTGQAHDLDQILALTRNCIDSMRGHGIDQWDEIYPDVSILEKDIEDQALKVCEANGRILGCVAFNGIQDPAYRDAKWRYLEPPIGVVHRLMVDPAAQGRGLAKALMSDLETRAWQSGVRAIRLDAFTSNPTALALYDKLGYLRAGVIRLRKGLFMCYEKPHQHCVDLLSPVRE